MVFPIKLDDYSAEELARRMRFESEHVIRFLSKDDRDILYLYDQRINQLQYLSEAKSINSFK